METSEVKAKRLIYQSFYRGCKETDIILGDFAKAHLKDLSTGELELFEKLLEEDDKKIFNWFTEVEALPKEHQNSVTEKIKIFLKNRV